VREKVVLLARFIEGDSGCRGEIKEFGIALGMSTRNFVTAGLPKFVQSHCETLISRGFTSQATPAQLELAVRILESGFEIQEEPPTRSKK